jgi:hypothetical protein
LKHGPFTIDQAAACGIRRQRLGRPNFKRIVRGVYIWSGLAAASNAQLLGVLRALPPASVFSGLTAARIRGLDLSPGAPNEVVVPLEAGVRSRPDLIVRREALRAADVVEVDGVPVSRVEPRRGAGISPGPFPRSALRTGRARHHASGSPRVHAVGSVAEPSRPTDQGVGMFAPRYRYRVIGTFLGSYSVTLPSAGRQPGR